MLVTEALGVLVTRGGVGVLVNFTVGVEVTLARGVWVARGGGVSGTSDDLARQMTPDQEEK